MSKKFSRHDAEKYGLVAGKVDDWRRKQGLTAVDILVGLRLGQPNKWDWEDTLDTAGELADAYYSYFDSGRGEQSAADRKIEELEAEVARLRGLNGKAD